MFVGKKSILDLSDFSQLSFFGDCLNHFRSTHSCCTFKLLLGVEIVIRESMLVGSIKGFDYFLLITTIL